MAKSNKCFVVPCTNYADQGTFIGQVCAPCFRLAEDIFFEKLNSGGYYYTPGVVRFIADNWREVIQAGNGEG